MHDGCAYSGDRLKCNSCSHLSRGYITCFCRDIHHCTLSLILPSQVLPSPKYPLIQVHEYEPIVLLHIELSPQSSLPSAHSSVSEQTINSVMQIQLMKRIDKEVKKVHTYLYIYIYIHVYYKWWLQVCFLCTSSLNFQLLTSDEFHFEQCTCYICYSYVHSIY